MARKRTVEAKIIWQSKHFPWMQFTDVQLAVFRERYPRILKWQPFLQELEAWMAANLTSNPDKIPTQKGWGNFLNNAARRRDRDIMTGRRRPDGTLVVDKNQSNAEYYRGQRTDDRSLIKKAEPTAIGDLFKRLAKDTSEQ